MGRPKPKAGTWRPGAAASAGLVIRKVFLGGCLYIVYYKGSFFGDFFVFFVFFGVYIVWVVLLLYWGFLGLVVHCPCSFAGLETSDPVASCSQLRF